jgi:hypothetical protein
VVALARLHPQVLAIKVTAVAVLEVPHQRSAPAVVTTAQTFHLDFNMQTLSLQSCRKYINVVVAGLLLCLSPLSLLAQTGREIRVISESAIPYTGFLAKAEFDKRYPGQLKSDPSELDSGWYVIYEHESLNYYFGPILLESTGKDYLEQLRTVVDSAVEQRPTITDYRLELSYEPSASSTSASDSAESDQSETSTSAPAQQEPQPSFWSMVRSIFGF